MWALVKSLHKMQVFATFHDAPVASNGEGGSFLGQFMLNMPSYSNMSTIVLHKIKPFGTL